MARTTPSAVQDVLGGDYDGTTTVTPFIDAANAVVSRVYTCAANKGITLSTVELELIERWLAAHFYTTSDPVYQSKNTSKAGASFVRPKELEPYLDRAVLLDYSGCLKNILMRQTASLTWLGRPPSEQTDYIQRD